jgi:hypothetical protein
MKIRSLISLALVFAYFASSLSGTEIAVYYADWSSNYEEIKDENAPIYKWTDWYHSREDKAKTIKAMYKEGWKLVHVVQSSPQHFYFYFEKEED